MSTKSQVKSMFSNDDTLPKNESNWDTLPEKTRDMVREMILSAAEDRKGPECWKSDEECIEELEYRSRDGFSAFDSNRGGITYNNFCTVADYDSGGSSPSHEKAAKEIQSQIDYCLEYARESFFEKNAELLTRLGFTKETVNYHDLYDNKASALADELSEYERDSMSDDSSSIMHEFRFLYHGKDASGIHTASVSAAVNTEGPYHRSSIEITWKNTAELKRKLAKALTQVSKEIF